MITAEQAKEMAHRHAERIEQNNFMEIMKIVIDNANMGQMSAFISQSVFSSTRDTLLARGFAFQAVSGGFEVRWGTLEESAQIQEQSARIYENTLTISWDPIPLSDGLRAHTPYTTVYRG